MIECEGETYSVREGDVWRMRCTGTCGMDFTVPVYRGGE